MAARRANRTPFRRRRRRAPLRTHGVKETRWNTSRFATTSQFIFDFEPSLSRDIVIMDPKVLFEMQLQPTTPVGGPVTNIAPLLNTLNAGRGVKVGGIVWDSGFHVQNGITSADNETYVVAYSKCIETLWTREVDDEGIGQEVPLIEDTWRPLRVDDSVFVPGENDGDLVRIHHTRATLLAAGDNAYGWNGTTDTVSLGAVSPAASTWTLPTWGGTRSIRLRKFIADDQMLTFNLFVDNPNPASTEQAVIVWTINATVYWAPHDRK